MNTFSRGVSGKKRVFISFDYDSDRTYRYLLSALKANAGSKIDFEDLTPGEIQSYDVDRIKAALTRRIKDSDYTLVVIGSYANSYHKDRVKIGTRNWQWWEIEKAALEGHKFIAVKIESTNASPEPLLGKSATYSRSFKVDSILRAIQEA